MAHKAEVHCYHHLLTSRAADGFFFSSSHLRNLQIWWPVLRFRQLLHCSQFIRRRQGGHMPQRFRFFLPELIAEASSLCAGYSARLAMCRALSARNTPAGVMMKSPGLKGKPPPTPYGKSTGPPTASVTDVPSKSLAPEPASPPPTPTPMPPGRSMCSIPARFNSAAAWAKCSRPFCPSRTCSRVRSNLAAASAETVGWGCGGGWGLAEWRLLSVLSLCPLVVAEETALYWERVREFLRLLLSGSLRMPLRFLRSVTGESCLQLPRSRSSVRPPSDSLVVMVQSVRAWVGGEGGKGAGVSEEGEQRPFLCPFCVLVRVVPHFNGPTNRPANRQAPEPSARTIAQPSSTFFHGSSANLTQGREESKFPINDHLTKTLKCSRQTFSNFVQLWVNMNYTTNLDIRNKLWLWD